MQSPMNMIKVVNVQKKEKEHELHRSMHYLHKPTENVPNQ